MKDLRLSWLVHFFGDAFVADSLALTRDELVQVRQFDQTTAELEGTRPAAGTVLAELADRLRTRDDAPLSMRLWEAAEGLAQWDADLEATIAAWLRQQSGAAPPAIATSDPVALALCQIAAAIAPVFALWEAEDGGLYDAGVEPGMDRHGVGAAFIADHPSCEAAMTALRDDSALSRLLAAALPTDPLPGPGDIEFVYVGSKLHAAHVVPRDTGLLAALIHGAYDEVRVAGDSGVDALIAAIPGYLDRLRTALDGGPWACAVLVGIGNLVLPEHTEIATPWGELRAPRAGDRDFILDQGAAGCVLQFDLKTTLVVDHEHFDVRDATVTREANERARMIGLAGLLAQDDSTTTVGLYRSWVAVPNPMHPSTFRWPPARVERVWAPATVAAIERFADCVNVAHAVHRRSVDIAVQRCLRALAERDDPVDALIDAVIVWENLFGAGSELSFRVSTAIATLLGVDAAQRRALQNELKVLYNTRSQVVHGAAKTKALTPAQSDRAITLAVEILRAVYLHHPHLLTLEPSDRALTVLLG